MMMSVARTCFSKDWIKTIKVAECSSDMGQQNRSGLEFQHAINLPARASAVILVQT